jgi:TfoX/Sxy family transcriptional regulator of competence genes
MGYDEDLADRIRVAIQDVSGVSEKRMFGGLAFLVGGHMAVSVSGKGGLMVRCDPAQTDALTEQPGARPFEMRGKEMDGWLRVDAAAVAGDDDLGRWVQIGVGHAQTLPPK